MAEFIAAVPDGETVVAMQVFNGTLFVALSCGVFVLRDNEFVPLPFTTEAKLSELVERIEGIESHIGLIW